MGMYAYDPPMMASRQPACWSAPST
jgi:hypothetical protein